MKNASNALVSLALFAAIVALLIYFLPLGEGDTAVDENNATASDTIDTTDTESADSGGSDVTLPANDVDPEEEAEEEAALADPDNQPRSFPEDETYELVSDCLSLVMQCVEAQGILEDCLDASQCDDPCRSSIEEAGLDIEDPEALLAALVELRNSPDNVCEVETVTTQ